MSKENHNNFSNITLQVLGCRGSMSVSRPSYAKYGVATSSYLYMTDEEAIILDAGTGILNLPDLGGRRISILISHSHIDHILGLPIFLGSVGAKELSIYGATHEGLTIRQQLDTYLKRPLWPVGLDDFSCKITFENVKENTEPFQIGDVTITAVPSNHPGGSTIYKLECQGVSVVYASDFEHEELPDERKDKGLIEAEEAFCKKKAEMSTVVEDGSQYTFATDPLQALSAFSKNADLILYDAQYTAEEYQNCKAFGHSTAEKAYELKCAADIKQVLLVHHAPFHTDMFLDEVEKEILCKYNCTSDDMHLAREGEVIRLPYRYSDI
ncbi:MAG: MBL fold metallo-hydrolase [Butyrivibrio sp.]|nr:MBL fold metallo-hydrolase [Butyrivibrio sp.]